MKQEEIIKALKAVRKIHNGNYAPQIDEAIKELKRPTVRGKWIMTNDYMTCAYSTIDYVRCSYCNYESLEEGKYCPNCGTKMEDTE